MTTTIFVFGSNLAGKHGKGAALYARKYYLAQYGVGVGLTGHAYAIPTKDHSLNVLPLTKIKQYINDFIIFAKSNPNINFNVTRIGCGLAGYKDQDIAPMFKHAPKNCILPDSWKEILNRW